jgi:hypothetical protein
VPPIVQIFSRESRTRRTLGSHEIQVFCHWSEQLIGREAIRELKEASVHVLGTEASPEAALTITKHLQVQDVLSWTAPTSVADIQSFLGLAGYYRRIFKDKQAYDQVAREG